MNKGRNASKGTKDELPSDAERKAAYGELLKMFEALKQAERYEEKGQFDLAAEKHIEAGGDAKEAYEKAAELYTNDKKLLKAETMRLKAQEAAANAGEATQLEENTSSPVEFDKFISPEKFIDFLNDAGELPDSTAAKEELIIKYCELLKEELNAKLKKLEKLPTHKPDIEEEIKKARKQIGAIDDYEVRIAKKPAPEESPNANQPEAREKPEEKAAVQPKVQNTSTVRASPKVLFSTDLSSSITASNSAKATTHNVVPEKILEEVNSTIKALSSITHDDLQLLMDADRVAKEALEGQLTSAAKTVVDLAANKKYAELLLEHEKVSNYLSMEESLSKAPETLMDYYAAGDERAITDANILVAANATNLDALEEVLFKKVNEIKGELSSGLKSIDTINDIFTLNAFLPKFEHSLKAFEVKSWRSTSQYGGQQFIYKSGQLFGAKDLSETAEDAHEQAAEINKILQHLEKQFDDFGYKCTFAKVIADAIERANKEHSIAAAVDFIQEAKPEDYKLHIERTGLAERAKIKVAFANAPNQLGSSPLLKQAEKKLDKHYAKRMIEEINAMASWMENLPFDTYENIISRFTALSKNKNATLGDGWREWFEFNDVYLDNVPDSVLAHDHREDLKAQSAVIRWELENHHDTDALVHIIELSRKEHAIYIIQNSDALKVKGGLSDELLGSLWMALQSEVALQKKDPTTIKYLGSLMVYADSRDLWDAVTAFMRKLREEAGKNAQEGKQSEKGKQGEGTGKSAQGKSEQEAGKEGGAGGGEAAQNEPLQLLPTDPQPSS
jgi:DNA-binding Lrp family transcriptional regulator